MLKTNEKANHPCFACFSSYLRWERRCKTYACLLEFNTCQLYCLLRLQAMGSGNGKWSSSAPCLLYSDLYRIVGASHVFLKCKRRKKRGQLVSSAFTTSWRQKQRRLNDNRAACLSIQAFPANLACNKERGPGGGGWKGALLPLPQRAGSQATLLLFEYFKN